MAIVGPGLCSCVAGFSTFGNLVVLSEGIGLFLSAVVAFPVWVAVRLGFRRPQGCRLLPVPTPSFPGNFLDSLAD